MAVARRPISSDRPRYLLAVPAVYFVFYMVYFSLLQEYARPKFWIYSSLDGLFPFCEFFVIPYVLWFLLVPLLFAYFYLKDLDSYLYLCRVIFIGLTLCLLIYTFLPNGQLLRRPLPRDNFLCQLVELIRRTDPPINVCPSIHVFVSAALGISAQRAASLRSHPRIRIAVQVLSVLICMSTVFLKQHSIIDVALGLALALLLDALAVRGWLSPAGWRTARSPFRRRKSLDS